MGNTQDTHPINAGRSFMCFMRR